VKLIHEKCEIKASQDKSLPKNAYLVTYVESEKLTYDIVMADGKVEIFDHYWDKYKEGLQNIGWCEGNVNPKMWNLEPKEKKKVTKKPRRRQDD
jgi:hypothetical protein